MSLRAPLLALLSVLFAAGTTGCKGRGPVAGPNEKVFRYAIQSKATSLDPHATSDVYSTIAESLVYESLYQYHYLDRPMRVIPALAEALPEISADGRRARIRLKKGIFFHDDPCFKATQGRGREVVADDVIYMLHRVSAPGFVAPYYSSFEGMIEGIDAYHSGGVKLISGIERIGRHELVIRLTRPSPRFVYSFVSVHSAIVPKECVEHYGDEFGKHPVGTGAFKITEHSDSKIVAVRNPTYATTRYPSEASGGAGEGNLLADAGKALPFLDRVVLEVLSEDQPTWLKFLAGETEISRIPKDSLASAVPGGRVSPELSARGVRLLRAARGDVTVLIFNMENPIWGKQKLLRQAIALAVDVPKLIEMQYSGQAVRADGVLDPTSYGFDPNYRSRWHNRDLVKARELLAKAGYPGGAGLPPLVMSSSEGPVSRLLYELLARSLSEVGITLKQEVNLWAEMLRKTKEKNFTVVGMAFSSDTPDPDGTFDMFLARNASPGQNTSNYKNPEFDRLAGEMKALANGPERLAKIAQLRAILEEDLPMVPLTHRIGNQLVQPWVENHVYADEIFLGNFMKYKKVVPGWKPER
jgi:oligopeptide transport system substrate-binding protein